MVLKWAGLDMRRTYGCEVWWGALTRLLLMIVMRMIWALFMLAVGVEICTGTVFEVDFAVSPNIVLARDIRIKN